MTALQKLKLEIIDFGKRGIIITPLDVLRQIERLEQEDENNITNAFVAGYDMLMKKVSGLIEIDEDEFPDDDESKTEATQYFINQRFTNSK